MPHTIFNEFNFHDTLIVSIQGSATYPYELIIGITTEEGVNYRLVFTNAYWELSAFHTQNVLFDLQVVLKSNISNLIIEEYEIEATILQLINEQNYLLIILEPSVGMGGFIVAQEINLLLAAQQNPN